MSQATKQITCGQCGGAGSVRDPDPYADRRQLITCPTCGGRRKLTVPEAKPELVQFKGWDSALQKFAAAYVREAMSRDDLDAVYRKLVPAARQQIRLARKWKLWGVLASDDWAAEFGPNPVAP